MSTESSTIVQKVENARKAENKLTDLKADEENKNQYLGVPSTASIIDVKTENLDENIVIQFIVQLPTEKTGYIDFTQYMVDNGKLDIFLDNIGCTVNDITDGLYADIPVTYTDWYGWQAYYSKNKSNLKAYKNKSNWRKLDDETGYCRPNKKQTSIYNSIFIISLLISVYYFNVILSEALELSLIMSSIIAVISLAFIWYCDAAFTGMFSPKSVDIRTE